MSITEKRLLGNIGEQAVEKWLALNSFKILARNYSVRCGEVDLIAQQNDIIAFIEVKTRKTEYFPTSLVVNKSKQLKIIKAAKYFVLQNQIQDKVLRFDVATVLLNPKGQHSVTYIPNAFNCPER